MFNFGKDMNSLISLVIGLIVPLLSFYKDDFSIKWPTKADIPLNKKTKQSYWYSLLSETVIPIRKTLLNNQ